ncbi:MAG: glycosyltransferase [Planctomycetota bacterium]|nr:glycosyltransferase [Planctomycetota bacterium]
MSTAGRQARSLSVIIPTYNRAEFVRACIQSLHMCGVDDLQIIVADDGSTDNTAEVVKETDAAAEYHWQPNSGTPATARNAGFSIATGKYVAFVDCDDLWLPDSAAEAIKILEAHPEIDVIFSDAQMGNEQQGYRSWIQESGQEEFRNLPCKTGTSGVRIFEQGPFFRRMLVRNPVFIGAVIVRREAFIASGMFDAGLRGAADWELWLRMASRMTFAYMEQPIAVYTRHLDAADNMSSDFDGMNDEFIRALRNVQAKCRDLSICDQDLIKQQLRNHLFNFAYAAYNRGDIQLARTRFEQLRCESGLTAMDALYWTACRLPPRVANSLRRLKQLTGI